MIVSRIELTLTDREMGFRRPSNQVQCRRGLGARGWRSTSNDSVGRGWLTEHACLPAGRSIQPGARNARRKRLDSAAVWAFINAMPTPETVLITGAAGLFGGILRQHWGDRYELRLADLQQIDDLSPHETFVQTDITDLEQIINS